MKLTRQLLSTAILLGGLLISVTGLAHVSLGSSVPENGAVVNSVPDKLNLKFTAAVRLLKLELGLQDGKKFDIGFEPTTDSQEQYSVTLPAQLPTGKYRAAWTIMGADGHPMSDLIEFTYDPEAMSHGGEAHQEHADNASHGSTHH